MEQKEGGAERGGPWALNGARHDLAEEHEHEKGVGQVQHDVHDVGADGIRSAQGQVGGEAQLSNTCIRSHSLGDRRMHGRLLCRDAISAGRPLQRW